MANAVSLQCQNKNTFVMMKNGTRTEVSLTDKRAFCALSEEKRSL